MPPDTPHMDIDAPQNHPPQPHPCKEDSVDTIIAQWQAERPDLSTEALTAMALIGRIKRLSALLDPALAKPFKSYGLSAAEFDVLATLRRSGSPFTLSPTELFAQTMVTSGTMTHRLKLLANKNYIERLPNPTDSRSLLVRLTDVGRALIDQALEDHVANERLLLVTLSEPQRDELNRGLRMCLLALESQ